MNRASIIFCISSLVLSLGLSAALFPVATLSTDEVKAFKLPVYADEVPDLTLPKSGTVSVSEIVDFYVEYPPETAAGKAPEEDLRFQGC